MIKAGDAVMCIDPGIFIPVLSRGSVYRVDEADSEGDYVLIIGRWYRRKRFIKLPSLDDLLTSADIPSK